MSGRTSNFESTQGGVMTVEVGAVTGELEVTTETSGGKVAVRIRYAGAEDHYTVEGSPAATQLEPDECHERVVAILTTPGEKRGFNEDPVTLPGAVS